MAPASQTGAPPGLTSSFVFAHGSEVTEEIAILSLEEVLWRLVHPRNFWIASTFRQVI